MSSQSHRGTVRRAPVALFSLLALLTLLASLFVGTFVHTDDGCAVERHCATCVFALHQVDRSAVPEVVLPVSLPTELAAPPAPARLYGEARLHASRGPPAV